MKIYFLGYALKRVKKLFSKYGLYGHQKTTNFIYIDSKVYKKSFMTKSTHKKLFQNNCFLKNISNMIILGKLFTGPFFHYGYFSLFEIYVKFCII
jgi:hypothetical protein